MLTWRFQEQATTQVWTENKQCKHFLYKGTVEKLMCSSPKVALLSSIQHLLQTMLHGMALFYNTKIQNAPPWKLTNVEWFQAIKFAYREWKGKNTTNLPTHETTYLLKYKKATLWHSFKAKKTKVCFVSSERQYKKPAIFPWCNTRATVKSTNCLLFFVNGTVF